LKGEKCTKTIPIEGIRKKDNKNNPKGNI
jgi:hypothetical protein